MRKLRGKELYQVKNTKTGEIFSKETTKQKAEAQMRILEMNEFNEYLKTVEFPINPFQDLVKINKKYTDDKNINNKLISWP